MLENEFAITGITINPTARCFCPLGNDWYTNQFTVSITPAALIPDYCDIDTFVGSEINGKKIIIEEAVIMLYDFIKKNYHPAALKVVSTVTDAAHSPVTVTKE